MCAAAPGSVQGHPVAFDSGSEGLGSAPMSRSGSLPGTPGSMHGHPVNFDSGSAGAGSAVMSRAGSEDLGEGEGGSVQVTAQSGMHEPSRQPQPDQAPQTKRVTLSGTAACTDSASTPFCLHLNTAQAGGHPCAAISVFRLDQYPLPSLWKTNSCRLCWQLQDQCTVTLRW